MQEVIQAQPILAAVALRHVDGKEASVDTREGHEAIEVTPDTERTA